MEEWQKLWNRKYTGRWDGTHETRDSFEQVVARLRDARPNMARPVWMIPVGDVFAALDQKMKAGQVPGFDTVWLLYKDGIHMNKYGSYLTALAFFCHDLPTAPPRPAQRALRHDSPGPGAHLSGNRLGNRPQPSSFRFDRLQLSANSPWGYIGWRLTLWINQKPRDWKSRFGSQTISSG